MQQWKQLLVMAITCLVVSTILLVIAATSSAFAIFSLFLEYSYDRYTTSVVLETTIGTFILILGVGLIVLTYPVYRREKEFTSNSSRLPALEEG